MDLNLRIEAALQWIRLGIEKGGGGIAHSYSPIGGWGKAYPETTGYLIETLYDYAGLAVDPSLRVLALQCAEWLLKQQLPDYSFPGLTEGNKNPSVFNTGQILFGLLRSAAENPGNPAFTRAARKAADWMEKLLESDGSWRKAAYVPGFVPAYYTRALWPMMLAFDPGEFALRTEGFKKALAFYSNYFLPGGGLRDAGFFPGKPAFTHSLAYALEGFWECGLLLKEESVLENTHRYVRMHTQIYMEKGKIAGAFDEKNRGDYSFLCLTGNAQWSILCRKIYAKTGEGIFNKVADQLFLDILPHQYLGPDKRRYGAFPGSAPLWGPYQRFRYPNWGVKFFLDAARLYLGGATF